jgi:hypothetical protein
MRIEPEISAANIVLIGSFNPRIFRPEWFQSMDIIGNADDQSADDPPFVRIQDVVLKAFKEFLMHTPVYPLGINRTVHFSVGSFNVRDAIGRLLAPHEPWGNGAPRSLGIPKSPSYGVE